MKIGIVSSHHWPIPTPVHTGDIVLLDLAIALTELGHECVMFAPAGTKAPGKLCEMPAALGASTPTAEECEVATFNAYQADLLRCDIVHDFSTEKHISERLHQSGRPVTQTVFGGRWTCPGSPRNLVLQSHSHRKRMLAGQTDYFGTPFPDLAGPGGPGISDAHVAYNGIDTDFYCPGDTPKASHWLWLGRWHPVRGFKLAIDIARATGIELVMCGEDPRYMRWASEQRCAAEAFAYAGGLPNVRFEYLPPDPDHHTAKREQYRMAKAFLLPTQFAEPFGLQQVEATACGTPVLSTDYGSMPELGLAEVVHNGLADFVEAVRSIESGRAFVAKDASIFTRRAMAERCLVEYQQVIDGKGWGGR